MGGSVVGGDHGEFEEKENKKSSGAWQERGIGWVSGGTSKKTQPT